MSAIDDFASSLLEESKRFLEKARDCDGGSIEQTAYLHAALMLGSCSLDAHVNSLATDFQNRPEMTVHDLGILLEREVRLEDGEFMLKKDLRISRLEDRIQFLHKRCSGKAVNKNEQWWSDLAAATSLRNQLTHPKQVPAISVDAVARAIQAIIDTLDVLYLAIHKSKFPAASDGLLSRLNF